MPGEASDPRNKDAFPILSDEQIQDLTPYGKELRLSKGAEVWKAGTPNLCMFVVLDGEMTILDGRGGFVASHPKGEFSGDIDIITGRPSVVTAKAETQLRVLEVAGDCVKSIVSERPELGEVIFRAFLMRRVLLQEMDMGVLIIGSRFNPDTLRIREFLTRNRLPVHYEDLESSKDASALLAEFQVSLNDTPMVVLPNGTVLRSPSNVQLAEELGVLPQIESKIYDLVIVGAGPAGLAAGVYAASEGLSTLILDSDVPGGQAGSSSKIENYMGFPLGLSGRNLTDRGVAQAEKFGAQMVVPACARSLTCNHNGVHEIEADGVKEKIVAHCIVLAPGAHYRRLELAGQERFEGNGIYYSATNVERTLCDGSPVAVVGGGNSAGQAAAFMSERSPHIFLIIRGDDLAKEMSAYLALRIRQLAKEGRLSLLLNSEITGVEGESGLERIAIHNRRDGSTRNEPVAAVFVMIGAIPRTDWLPDSIARDPKGFILTGQQLVQEGKWRPSRAPMFLEASCPGVFAVGDARSGSIKRVASAVGEGSMSVALVHQLRAL